ncbi:hypothetical protein N9089_03750 [Crocinitomicaceae bacterium]|nr:hypothetical protein [Crocinitomicaceae bacterium]
MPDIKAVSGGANKPFLELLSRQFSLGSGIACPSTTPALRSGDGKSLNEIGVITYC